MTTELLPENDVVIVGGGPGGAALAMFLLAEGITPTIIEMEQFPRYHIGESLTGAGGKVLRDLGLEPEMRRRGYPTKQGVKVYGTSGENSWWVPVTGRDENWELFEWDTWQVRRSDFDSMMLDEAVKRGANLIKGKATTPVIDADGTVSGVSITLSDGTATTLRSRMLVDASGQATWLANLGGVTGPKYLGAYDKQVAFFSQVKGALRDHGEPRTEHPDNTLIFYQQKYHWSWFIPLDEDVVSVGIVCPSAYFLEKGESKPDFLARELRELNPELTRRVQDIEFVEDVHVIPNYSYQVKDFTGRGFVCLGDAHRFIDPIFSFGLTVAMREAQFLAPAIKQYLSADETAPGNPFAEYELFCEKGIDVLEDSLDMFWEQPLAFAVGVHSRYTNDMTDMFAGRIYERQPSTPILAFRKVLKRVEERERSYIERDIYSMPIGSRYHPERAAIWEPGAKVETTERWLGPR